MGVEEITPDESLDGLSWSPSEGTEIDVTEDIRSKARLKILQDAMKRSFDAKVSREGMARAVPPEHVSPHHEGEFRQGEPGSPTTPETEPQGNLPATEGEDSLEEPSLISLLEQVSDAWAIPSVIQAVKDCKTQPTGTGNGIFPLPTAQGHPLYGRSREDGTEVVVRNMCRALNSLYGCEVDPARVSSSKAQKRVLEVLQDHARIVRTMREKIEPVSWGELFSVKGIDYKGDEVLVAKTTEWGNIRPALPKEVAQVCLDDVCSGGVLHYVQHFEDFILPEEDLVVSKPPRVMVAPEKWEELAKGLIDSGVCSVLGESELFHVKGYPLLNGLFGVSKQEFEGSFEVHRLIMNLIPANRVMRGIQGDVSTLPSWASMGPLMLEADDSLVISSEDVRCFFYIFRAPKTWRKFMGFNRPLPRSMHPAGGREEKYYLVSNVLPMGFKNSVSIAQHVHRNILRWSSGGLGQSEIRKDRAFPVNRSLVRVYLDNFDQLEKFDSRTASLLEGSASAETLALRAEYARWGVPRHPKKSVCRASKAEVQGAILDGAKGVAYPKAQKMGKYIQLCMLLLNRGRCSQRQAQVIGGGLVYLSMFRRPLLGGLNALWNFIVSFETHPPVVQLSLPAGVSLELTRFLSLVPLAMMNFRLAVDPKVTASDASSTGGGITVSTCLTGYGAEASKGMVRGDLPGPECLSEVLTIGLFDGIGALRVAVDALGLESIGHISVECSKSAQRVVESHFADAIMVSDVSQVDEAMVRQWSCRFSQAALILIGAGPPCQGVSGLNSERKGALRDARSSLYVHVPRIRELVKKAFPWAMVHSLMESVASMDEGDRSLMSEAEGSLPWRICAGDVSLARRPRLYWLSWELQGSEGITIVAPKVQHGEWNGLGEVELSASLATEQYITPGWQRTSQCKLPTFTTSRPRGRPGPRPAGLGQCQRHELDRWEGDQFRFPPYQYRDVFGLVNPSGTWRYPDVSERELMMGFPLHYTSKCFPKQEATGARFLDERYTLLGNSWNVTVIVWLLGQLCGRLGLCSTPSPQEAVTLTSPGGNQRLQTWLTRAPLQQRVGRPLPPDHKAERHLVKKLCGLISVRGEDLLVAGASEPVAKYQRLRATIPSRLWRWRTVCGWAWSTPEHINVLELRAALTCLRWKIEKKLCFKTKFVHLLDSMVVLNALARGRSSSRKMRRALLKANALLLASGCQVVWAYVHTSINPADKPSRRPIRRKWGK